MGKYLDGQGMEYAVSPKLPLMILTWEEMEEIYETVTGYQLNSLLIGYSEIKAEE